MEAEKPELEAILRRIEKLEKENRRLRRAGLAIAVVAIAVFAMAEAKPDRTVEAEKFILRDPDGKIRAMLCLVNGGPTLMLNDEQENPELQLAVVQTRATVALFRPGAGMHSKPQLLLDSSDNITYLSLADASGAERASFQVYKGDPELLLKDAEGFETVIGKTDIVMPHTGETRRTSAASLVFFTKDGAFLFPAR